MSDVRKRYRQTDRQTDRRTDAMVFSRAVNDVSYTQFSTVCDRTDLRPTSIFELFQPTLIPLFLK